MSTGSNKQWEAITLSSICSTAKNIKWNEERDDREYRYIDLTSVDRVSHTIVSPQVINKSNAPSRAQKIVVTNDVLFATTRPTLRRYCLIGSDFNNQICSTGYCVIRPNQTRILPSWIYYLLTSDAFYNYIEPLQTGATYPAVTDKDVLKYAVPLPSLSEQQRIVGILDAEFEKIDALKANAEKNLQNAKDLFQAALKKELEPKDEWKDTTISNVCSIFGRIGFRGYTTGDLVANADDGAITLSPSNITDNKMNYDRCSYISWRKYEESPEIKIYDGDILLVKTGSSYGKCALVDHLPHKATINPQFVVLKEIKINRHFLYYCLCTPYSKSCFDEFVSGTAIPTFSQKNLGQMKIAIPSKEEQLKIVSHLDELSNRCKQLQDNHTQTIALCDNLKQALLRKAFNGDL